MHILRVECDLGKITFKWELDSRSIHSKVLRGVTKVKGLNGCWLDTTTSIEIHGEGKGQWTPLYIDMEIPRPPHGHHVVYDGLHIGLMSYLAWI